MKIICGVDEAGRGPLIGPLIVAGIAIKESDISKLTDLEVKDSKLHSPNRRQELFEEIKKIAHSYEIITVPAQEIDSRCDVGMNLNKLEALKVANVLDKLNPNVAYVDSPTSPDGAHFKHLIKEHLENHNIDIHAGHKFDHKYPVVSAASILAKVTRDSEVKRIEKEVGESIGSGYPADEITQKFLREHLNNSVSKYIRKTWATWKNLQAEKDQSSLGEF
ncbi:MAG: ribonuclease HII [Candidatus Woesearchaeota archaeon]|nr:MAG: ribonuclease HII [Candidatus Woesearchaeota archaeon]